MARGMCALALALPPRSDVPASKSESTGPLQTTSGSRLMPSCELGASLGSLLWQLRQALEKAKDSTHGVKMPWWMCGGTGSLSSCDYQAELLLG